MRRAQLAVYHDDTFVRYSFPPLRPHFIHETIICFDLLRSLLSNQILTVT